MVKRIRGKLARMVLCIRDVVMLEKPRKPKATCKRESGEDDGPRG